MKIRRLKIAKELNVCDVAMSEIDDGGICEKNGGDVLVETRVLLLMIDKPLLAIELGQVLTEKRLSLSIG